MCCLALINFEIKNEPFLMWLISHFSSQIFLVSLGKLWRSGQRKGQFVQRLKFIFPNFFEFLSKHFYCFYNWLGSPKYIKPSFGFSNVTWKNHIQSVFFLSSSVIRNEIKDNKRVFVKNKAYKHFFRFKWLQLVWHKELSIF